MATGAHLQMAQALTFNFVWRSEKREEGEIAMKILHTIASILIGDKYHIVASARWKEKCDLANECILIRPKIQKLEHELQKNGSFICGIKKALAKPHKVSLVKAIEETRPNFI